MINTIHALFFFKNQDFFPFEKANSPIFLTIYVKNQQQKTQWSSSISCKNYLWMIRWLQSFLLFLILTAWFLIQLQIPLLFYILLIFFHKNNFYEWLVDKILTDFWMDISFTKMLLGSFVNVLGHVYWGKTNLLITGVFFKFFWWTKGKYMSCSCPSKQ